MIRCLALVALLALPLSQADGDSLRTCAAAIAQAHREANALAKTDPAAAAALLWAQLGKSMPQGEQAHALRADLFARVSELRLEARDAQGALQAARGGLSEDTGRPTPLTALLKLREGEALEALSRDDLAVDAYSQVIAVAKKLLDERRGTGRQP
jgi:hypothetical protein